MLHIGLLGFWTSSSASCSKENTTFWEQIEFLKRNVGICVCVCVCVCVVTGDDGQSPLQIVVVCNSLPHNQEIPRLILSPDNDYPVLVSTHFLRVYAGIVH